MNNGHRFTTCVECGYSLNFEHKRKRIENGKWTHEACFVKGNHKPYPVPHQRANGMRHRANGGWQMYTAPYVTPKPPKIVNIEPIDMDQPFPSKPVKTASTGPASASNGILETLIKDLIKDGGLNHDEIRAIIKEEVTNYIPKTHTLEIVRPDLSKIKLEGAHKQFEKLMHVVSFGKHAYLYGAPGSFKSTTAKMVSDALGVSYAYTSLNPQTPESRLLGFMHAGGQYVETEFYRLCRDGGVFCIDEMDNASPALLNTLNSLLDNGHASFPCGTIERHPKFVVVATGNTNGNGGNVQFPDRRAFDPAFKERFACIQWDYDEQLEHAITLNINPDALPWLNWVRAVRAFVDKNDIRLVASPRASFNGALFLKDDAFTVSEIAEMVVFKGLDRDTFKNVVRACPIPEINGRTK